MKKYFKSREFVILLLIVAIATFFRFYNVLGYQYWSGDEEWAGALVRKMVVEKRLVLISPNTTMGLSLGSFFHIFSIPLFLIGNMNMTVVLGFMGLVGVVSTFLLFWLGKISIGSRYGLIVSFLYSTSFLAGLFDRRWWPLSLNALLVSISLIGFYQVFVNKKYWYSILFFIGIGFAGHADPSLAVILIASIVLFILFRINPIKKSIILSAVTLLIFIAPVLFFEARHPGTVLSPFVQSLQKGSSGGISGNQFTLFTTNIGLETATRLFLPQATNFAENHFCYCNNYDKPYLGWLGIVLVALLLVFPIFKISKLPAGKEKEFLKIIHIFMGCFLVGSAIFGFYHNSAFPQHFFTIVFPIIFLQVGYSVYKLTQKKMILLFVILILIFIVNAYVLMLSSNRYPLADKTAVSNNLSKQLKDVNFSLYTSDDPYFGGGGFGELLIFDKAYPRKSYLYPFVDWMYRAHGLYTITPTDSEQETVVVISNPDRYSFDSEKTLYKSRVGNIEGVILDNRDGWFEAERLSSQ